MLAYLVESRQKSAMLKSFKLYTIDLILKTSPARLCRLFELASLKKGIKFSIHTQYVKIDSLQFIEVFNMIYVPLSVLFV